MFRLKKGTLKMVGYIDGKEVCSDKVSTANTAKKIVITPQNEFVYDSCDDAVIFNISVVDENDISVPTADNLIKFTVDGGEIIGVGNGDPNSHEADKAEERHLFNGLCQVIVKQFGRCGKMLPLPQHQTGLKVRQLLLNRLQVKIKRYLFRQ